MYILTGEGLGQIEESANKGTSTASGAKLQTAAQIYASQSKIRELTDANFWNIFSDLNKVMVVAFWATGCAPCNQVAEAMVKVANRCYKGPHGQVKFYHVQWDKKVNPRVYEQLGFKSIPVVFFFYTATGRPPTRECPLLEGSLPDSSQKLHEAFDPEGFLSRIRDILRRHQNNTGLKRIDFYDLFDFHHAYLGQVSVPWCRNLLEIRFINQTDWFNINNNSQKSKHDPAIQASHEKQISKNSLILQVDSIEKQRKQLSDLFDKAKKLGKSKESI